MLCYHVLYSVVLYSAILLLSYVLIDLGVYLGSTGWDLAIWVGIQGSEVSWLLELLIIGFRV